MRDLLVSRGCHPGLMELALQAGVARGGAGMLSLGEVPTAGFVVFHPGLAELALQAGVVGGEAGLMGVREVLWNCCFGNGDNPA
jgi:hypothetical protein